MSGHSAPPMALNELYQTSTTPCCCFNNFSPIVFTDFAALIAMSLTNVKPTIIKVNYNIHDSVSKPYLSFLIIVNKMTPIITQIVGTVSSRYPLP